MSDTIITRDDIRDVVLNVIAKASGTYAKDRVKEYAAGTLTAVVATVVSAGAGAFVEVLAGPMLKMVFSIVDPVKGKIDELLREPLTTAKNQTSKALNVAATDLGDMELRYDVLARALNNFDRAYTLSDDARQRRLIRLSQAIVARTLGAAGYVDDYAGAMIEETRARAHAFAVGLQRLNERLEELRSVRPDESDQRERVRVDTAIKRLGPEPPSPRRTGPKPGRVLALGPDDEDFKAAANRRWHDQYCAIMESDCSIRGRVKRVLYAQNGDDWFTTSRNLDSALATLTFFLGDEADVAIEQRVFEESQRLGAWAKDVISGEETTRLLGMNEHAAGRGARGGID